MSASPPGSRSGRGRAVVVAAVSVVHLVLFAALARSPALPPRRGLEAGAAIGLSLTRSPAAVRPTPAPAPSPAPSPARAPARPPVPPSVSRPPGAETPVRIAAPVEALAASGSALAPVSLQGPPTVDLSAPASAATAPPALGRADAKPCDLFGAVQAVLQTDDGVRAAIATIPRRARSVANAVLVWDGAWVEPAAVGGVAALEPIRRAVRDTVGRAPPDCQAEVVRGPRLATIGDRHDTTVLAFGSGQWRWGDLLPALPPPQSATVLSQANSTP